MQGSRSHRKFQLLTHLVWHEVEPMGTFTGHVLASRQMCILRQLIIQHHPDCKWQEAGWCSASCQRASPWVWQFIINRSSMIAYYGCMWIGPEYLACWSACLTTHTMQVENLFVCGWLELLVTCWNCNSSKVCKECTGILWSIVQFECLRFPVFCKHVFQHRENFGSIELSSCEIWHKLHLAIEVSN